MIRVQFLALVRFFIITTKPSLKPTQPPIQLLQGAHSQELKQLQYVTDHSLSSSTKVKNAWSSISIPPNTHSGSLAYAQQQLKFCLLSFITKAEFQWKFKTDFILESISMLWQGFILVSLIQADRKDIMPRLHVSRKQTFVCQIYKHIIINWQSM